MLLRLKEYEVRKVIEQSLSGSPLEARQEHIITVA